MEELVYFPNGYLFTRGPGAYKIPSFNDIPVDFRVSLLTEAANPRAVHSSKGVGEPPFFLAGSAFFAIKEAVRAARYVSLSLSSLCSLCSLCSLSHPLLSLPPHFFP